MKQKHTHLRSRRTTAEKLRRLAREADVSMADLMTQLVDRYGPKEVARIGAARNGKRKPAPAGPERRESA